MNVRSRSSISSFVSSCFCCFLAESVEGGSRAFRTRTRQAPLQEGVCILQLCMFVHVFLVVSYAAGHGKECVAEMVRVESTDSHLSATAVVKAPPRGTGECEITF